MWISATSHLQASKLQTNDYRVKRIFFIPLTLPATRATIDIAPSPTPDHATSPGVVPYPQSRYPASSTSRVFRFVLGW